MFVCLFVFFFFSAVQTQMLVILLFMRRFYTNTKYCWRQVVTAHVLLFRSLYSFFLYKGSQIRKTNSQLHVYLYLVFPLGSF